MEGTTLLWCLQVQVLQTKRISGHLPGELGRVGVAGGAGRAGGTKEAGGAEGAFLAELEFKSKINKGIESLSQTLIF